jgi:hypothetical protein
MARVLRIVVFCWAAVSSIAASAEAQATPEAWARRMAAAHDGRSAFEKMGDRSGKEGAKEAVAKAHEAIMKSLAPLVGNANSNVKMEVAFFVLQFDSLWNADGSLDTTYLSLLTSRLDRMTPEHFASWRVALRGFQPDLSDTAVVGLTARTDRLFDRAGFSVTESGRLQKRLGTVPDASVTALAKTLSASKADAALRVVEADGFWDAQGRFNVGAFDKALAILQGIRAK